MVRDGGLGLDGQRRNDRGDVIYYAAWNDPDTTRNAGIFINDRLIVQKGVTVISGRLLTNLAAVESNFAASNFPRSIIFEGTADTTIDGAFLITFMSADFNSDCAVTSADITSFLSSWFSDLGSGGVTADFDNNGVTNSADITAFLSEWFARLAGC